jgi:hypothetical protein
LIVTSTFVSLVVALADVVVGPSANLYGVRAAIAWYIRAGTLSSKNAS